ncbi:MAG: hypothetical protein ACK5HU_07265 [Flavobacteriales bacterium]
MKFRKFLLITLHDVMISLGKSMISQGNIINNTYDRRLLNLENHNIEENFDQVIDQKMALVNTPQFQIK